VLTVPGPPHVSTPPSYPSLVSQELFPVVTPATHKDSVGPLVEHHIPGMMWGETGQGTSWIDERKDAVGVAGNISTSDG
jgi:hypothetical protein